MSRLRRRLLLVTPVMPAETGNGLAMRAGLFLDALAADHEVFLLVIPVAGQVPEGGVPAFVAGRTARVVVLDLRDRVDAHYALLSRLKDPEHRLRALVEYPRPLLDRFATSETVGEAASRFDDVSFETVHVMRLYLASFARPFLEATAGRPACVLDLDDDETETRGRLAALYALRGDAWRERLELAESRKFGQLERYWLPRFDRVLVCSQGDCSRLAGRLRLGTVSVVPNAIQVPQIGARPPGGRDPGTLRLLFVGSLGYFPNEDAARFLSEEVRPRLETATRRQVLVQIVGAAPPPRIRRLAAIPGVTVQDSVPEVGPYYAAADVATVPVRAGGGTRIKVLEAFAHGVPVVSTRVGAEGLEVEPGTHLLVADDADTFAAACLLLAGDPARAEAQAARARTLVISRYAQARVTADIRALYRALDTPGAGAKH